jgi:hypothetical protein
MSSCQQAKTVSMPKEMEIFFFVSNLKKKNIKQLNHAPSMNLVIFGFLSLLFS